ERNEVLDCRNYAMAAFKALPADLDKIDRKLKEMSGARRESVATPSVTAPAARPQARQKNRTLERYYDDW
ncbi:MAG: phage terminase large subunit family protein, partial [Aristaeellaceae bacterium]